MCLCACTHICIGGWVSCVKYRGEREQKGGDKFSQRTKGTIATMILEGTCGWAPRTEDRKVPEWIRLGQVGTARSVQSFFVFFCLPLFTLKVIQTTTKRYTTTTKTRRDDTRRDEMRSNKIRLAFLSHFYEMSLASERTQVT